jgi:hypothetical protein
VKNSGYYLTLCSVAVRRGHLHILQWLRSQDPAQGTCKLVNTLIYIYLSSIYVFYDAPLVNRNFRILLQTRIIVSPITVRHN